MVGRAVQRGSLRPQQAAAPMAQAIDIDVDDANRLPTHWLHAAYAGADAPALIAARKAEVAGLVLGAAKERGVRAACARGDPASR